MKHLISVFLIVATLSPSTSWANRCCARSFVGGLTLSMALSLGCGSGGIQGLKEESPEKANLSSAEVQKMSLVIAEGDATISAKPPARPFSSEDFATSIRFAKESATTYPDFLHVWVSKLPLDDQTQNRLRLHISTQKFPESMQQSLPKNFAMTTLLLKDFVLSPIAQGNFAESSVRAKSLLSLIDIMADQGVLFDGYTQLLNFSPASPLTESVKRGLTKEYENHVAEWTNIRK